MKPTNDNNALSEIISKLKRRRTAVVELLAKYSIEPQTGARPMFSTQKTSLKELKVAAIMDAFTEGNFVSECELLQVTPDNWREEIEAFGPDLFFLESAWKGKDDLWFRKIARGGSKELYDLCEYLREKGIPIVFWNKEDPVWTHVFTAAAALADYVFTTDFDRIEHYKRALGHDNVYLLHFGAQPKVHNPIEKYPRKDKFCFAGAYYHRYPERCRVFDSFSDYFEDHKGLDIYDRNYKNARPEHKFPARYDRLILGNLAPEEIDVAYKGYNYGINMNSVGQSQSMFARRVFELLASNTVCVGNYAKGLKNYFGDLTICTDDAKELARQLDTFCGTPENYRKYRLAGLRKVLRSELCRDRLAYIVEKVFGKDMREPLLPAVILSDAKTPEEKARVRASFDRQTYENKSLCFIDEGAPIIPEKSLAGAMSPNDFYGENYLLDLVLSTRCADFEGYGKAYYYSENKAPSDAPTYKKVDSLYSTRALISAKYLPDDLAAFAKGVEIKGDFLCTDEFNYCENAAECPAAEDLKICSTGITIGEFDTAAKRIKVERSPDDEPVDPSSEDIPKNTETPLLFPGGIMALAGHYPSYGNLYRFMFFHRRVMEYKKAGLPVDVQTCDIYAKPAYREFQTVGVCDGNAERLYESLENGGIHTVCVHFLTPYIWSVLRNFVENRRIIIWSHGSDILPHTRRLFDFETEEELATAASQTEDKKKMWREVFRLAEKHDIRIVFVSNTFRAQVEEDYGADLSKISSVIHNCIDTDLFNYIPKDPEQRFKIMSAKSFSCKNYANDITRDAILLLSKEKEFSKMEFDLYGDGRRFNEDTAGLNKFSNVHLHRGFITPEDIAAASKTHGIFIATTRGDTQGVSRDEAMSAGLVTVTNRVGAIPEFTDDSCAVIAEAEDAEGVAQGILRVVRDPELFCKMSEAAARRVRNQTAPEHTIPQELTLIRKK